MPKHYFVIAGLVLLSGAATGAYLGWQKTQVIEQALEKKDEVLGEEVELENETQSDLSPSLSPSPGESGTSGSPSPGDGEGLRERLSQYSTPYQTPYQTPKPKPDPCIQAKADLDAAKQAAQKTYDAERSEIGSKLAGLARQRSDAVNSYLTAIALATSRYNSSTSPDAYTIYQQDQTVALNAYTASITQISAEETLTEEQKKASQAKYDEAIASAEAHFLAGSCS